MSKKSRLNQLPVVLDDHESPFLRTTSNNDIFNTIPDYKNDWAHQCGREISETEMNSQSYATLNIEESNHATSSALGLKDASNSKCWPFVFDSSFQQQNSQKELLNSCNSVSEMINPAHLGDVSGLTMMAAGNNDQYVFPNIPDNTNQDSSIMDAINALGSSAFSASFVEKAEELDHSYGQVYHQQHSSPKFASLYYEHHDPHAGPSDYLLYEQQNLSYWPNDPAAAAHHQYWMNAAANPPQLDAQQTQPKKKPPRPKKEKSKFISHAAASSTAAFEAGNRRRSSQHSIFCSECDENIGVIFIRGAYNAAIEHPADVKCKTCSGPQQQIEDTIEKDVSSAPGSPKKRKAKEDNNLVDCEVCRECIGTGGISAQCYVEGGEIKSEFVCTDCGNKYLFCSECGGGGKQRTGKWRPKELFELGRRTCSLPHIRVGAAEVHYKVIPVKDLTTEILQGIQDVFFDCLLSLYCVPTVMMTSKFGTFDTIKAEIEKLWLSSVLDVLTNNVLLGEKFITVAWIQKRHRNKGTGKAAIVKESSLPWLQKLNLSGIIAGAENEPGDEENDQCFVAFSIAEWDVASQSIFMAQMAPRSVFLKTMDGYVDLIKNCVASINSRATVASLPKPAHIWCWAKPDHARLQSIPIRLKFVNREDYLSSHPKLNPDRFDRPDYEPLQADGTVIYASSIKPFLSKV